MERLSIESLIVNENELAEHYKEAGNEYGYKGKSKLVEYLKELKTYKDAEEQRLLLRLPCKAGGKVYVIAPNYNKCENHYECEEYDSEQYLITWCQANCPKGFKGIGVVETKVVEIKIREGDIYLQTDRCGLRNTKNMFLTKEEAEQALKQMGE